MTYIGGLRQPEINKAQHLFWRFLGISIILVIFIVIWWNIKPEFWNGHKIWVSGAILVTLSVVHSKYFDINRSSNPGNLRYDPANYGKISTLCNIAEETVKLAWIIGFILIGVSRWIAI